MNYSHYLGYFQVFSPSLSTLLLLPLLLVAFSWRPCIAFQEPTYIPINKPSFTNSLTVSDSSGFAAALQGATPGTQIRMMAGVYTALDISSSGEAGNEIVIEPYGDGMVYIEVSGERTSWNWTGNHVILDGGPDRQITLRKGTETTEILSLIRLKGDSQTISGVVLQGPIGSCNYPTNTLISPNNGGTVPGKPSNYRIFSNILDSYSHKGIYAAGSVNGEIRNNIIRGGQGHAIQFNPHDNASYVDGVVIAGNLILNNGLCEETNKGGKGIYIDGDDQRAGTIANVSIYDNIIADNASNGIDLLSDATDLVGPEYIYHNTIFNNGGAGIFIDNNMPGNLVNIHNNIVFSNSSGIIDQTMNVHRSHNVTTDPQFRSTSQESDYFMMLSSSSVVAIDQGMYLNDVTGVDYFGGSRDETPDIGAHEYAESSSVKKGDIDGNATVDLADAITALKVLINNAQSAVSTAGDVNNDSLIGLPEPLYILQQLSK